MVDYSIVLSEYRKWIYDVDKDYRRKFRMSLEDFLDHAERRGIEPRMENGDGQGEKDGLDITVYFETIPLCPGEFTIITYSKQIFDEDGNITDLEIVGYDYSSYT